MKGVTAALRVSSETGALFVAVGGRDSFAGGFPPDDKC
jgi:hypothetical protein